LNPGVNPFQWRKVQFCKEIERNIQIVESEIKFFGLDIEDPESVERIPTHDEFIKIETERSKSGKSINYQIIF